MKRFLLLIIVIISVLFASTSFSQDYALSMSNGATATLPSPFSSVPTTFTIEWWMKPNTIINYNQRIECSNGEWRAFSFHTTVNGGVYVGTDLNTRFTPSDIPDGTVKLSEWQHFAFTYDNGNGNFYKDGTLISSKQNIALPQQWDGIKIGITDGQYDSYFDGAVNDVRVWDVARSASEIQNNLSTIFYGPEMNLVGLWNFDDQANGVITDLSGNNFHGSYTYGSNYVEKDDLQNIDNYALILLGGETGILPTPFSSPPTTFTIEWWMKPNTTSNYNQRIECSSNWGAFTFHTTENGGVYVGTDIPSRFTPSNIPNGTVVKGKWQHFAFTYDNGYGNFYKNGVVVSGKQNIALPQNWSNIKLGEPDNGYINGFIDDIRVWDIARSTQEIEENLFTDFDESEPNLVGLWNFNDQANGIITDSSGNNLNGSYTNGGYYLANDSESQKGKADTPFPETDKVVATNTSLSWKSFSYDKFIVYFGSDYEGVMNANAGSQYQVAIVEETSYTPPSLANNTEYFWRVDGVVGNDIISNPMWSFKTVSSDLESLQSDFLDLEFGMFLHFSIGTYTGYEWTLDPQQYSPNMFNPTELDCGQWADAMLSAGMKYAVLTAKHHDGFCLWPSEYSDFGVKNSNWKNGEGDVIKEYTDALRSRGIKAGLYFSVEDWYHKNVGVVDTEFVKNQLTELLDGTYGEISVLWTDGWGWGRGYSEVNYEEIYNHIKTLQPNILLIENNHKRYYNNTDVIGFEQNVSGLPTPSFNMPFEIAGNILQYKWFWPNETEGCQMKETSYFIEILESISGRGNYLLDCTPDQRGLIPDCQIDKLGEIGESLGVNLSVETQKEALEVFIYPNPVDNGLLHLELKNVAFFDKATIEIFDITGRKVYTNFTDSQSTTLKLEPNLQEGLYIISVTSGGAKYLNKFQVIR